MKKNISELRSRGVTCRMESDSVICHPTKETCPASTLVGPTSTWFAYPRRMEGWVNLGVGYIPKWFTWPHTLYSFIGNQ